MKKKVSIAFALAGLLLLAGCGSGGGNNSDFFNIETVFSLNGIVKPDPNVSVSGIANAPTIDCTEFPNGVASFSGTTNSNALFTVQNAALGGSACAWNIIRGTSANCSQSSATTIFVTIPGQTYNVPCRAPGAAVFTANPDFIDPTNPPSTMTITGQNIGSAYAMPQITFYDVNQNAILTVTASSVASDGTWVTIPANQVTFSNGGYGAVVYVMQSNGTWDSIGGAGVTLDDGTGSGGGGGGCPCQYPL